MHILKQAEQYAYRIATSVVDAYDDGEEGERQRKWNPPGVVMPRENAVWMHRSDQEIPVGTELSPHPGTGIPSTAPDYMQGRHNWVWMDNNGKSMNPEKYPYLYELKPSEGPYPWNGVGTEGWVSPSATVVRRVK